MFWRKKDKSAAAKPSANATKPAAQKSGEGRRVKHPAKAIGNAPLTAYEYNRREWAERNGDSTVNQARFFILALVGMLAAAGMAFALSGLTPLKTVIPFNITFDRETGETRATRITSAKFVPDQVQKSYFIGRWVRQLLALDPFTTERDLSEAFGFVRGKAVDEMRDYIRATQPVARLNRDSTLTRSVQITTLQYIDENIAQVRVATTERSAKGGAGGGGVVLQKRFVITLHFVTEPPATEPEMLANPIGLHIVHFSISEEMQ